MEAVATRTLEALKAHRAKFIDLVISSRDGRIVKLLGNGVLIEDPSVGDVVEYSVVLQQGVAKRNIDELDYR